MKKVKNKKLYGGGGEVVAPSEDISKHKNYYVNNLTLLSEDEKKALIKASEISGVSPEIIWTNMMAEGMDIYLQDAKKGYYTKTDDGYIDGFQYFGFDTLGDSLPNNKYLPKDISYTTERKLAEEELKKYQNSPHLTQAEKDRFNDPAIFMTSNEKGETVNYASPKSLTDAFYMMGAELRTRKDTLETYASKNNIELSPKSKDFFTYVSYNSGEGNMQKMLTSYNTKGYLKDDNYLENKPDKYWEDSYTYAQKRIKNQTDVQSTQYLSSNPIITKTELAKEENPVLDKINTIPLNKSFDNLNTTINTPTLKKINKYKLGGTLTGGEGSDSNVKNTASLYQRLLEKKIIDSNITELQFSQLPKEQIDSYFKKYGEVIGAKTQAEVDAMPGEKQYLTPTIFTGMQATNSTGQTFDTAFATARKAGLKEFNYSGKLYSTELGNSNSTPAVTSKPMVDSGAATQINTDYMANIVQKKYGGALPSYNIGGSIGTAAGQAMQFIPGLGPIASAIATPLLTEVGNAISGELSKTKIPVAKEVAKTINPIGSYKQGGLIQYAAGGKPTGEDGYVQPKEVYDYLISKGLSKEHALGMLANVQYESSFRPHAIGDEGTSGGLFQHHNERFDAMKKYAGEDWATDWKGQVDYALSEADTKKYTSQKFTSPSEASMWFTKNWERPDKADEKAKERVTALESFTFANEDNTTFIDGAQGRIIAAGNKAMQSQPNPMILKYKDKVNALNSSIKKYGGQVAQNVVATSGGKFEDLGGNILLAKGNLHSQGGIKLDTNSAGGFDGIADIEVEDGEPIITDAGDTGYVINRDIAKPYIKLLKQLGDRHDKVSETGRTLFKQEMIKKNEAMKASKGLETGATQSFEYGGGFPIDPMYGQGAYGTSDPEFISMADPATFSADWQEMPTPPAIAMQYLAGVSNTSGIVGDKRLQLSQYDFSRTTPQLASYDNINMTNNAASNKVISSDTAGGGSTYRGMGDAGNTELKTPKGDMLQLAGMAIPTLYNLGRGLFDKAEVVDPAYNPYEGKALSTLASRTYNPQAIQNQLDRTFTAGRQDINNMTSSAGSRLGNVQNLYGNLGQQRAAADLQGQQMNNQYKADYASALDNFGRQRQAAEGVADEYNWANRVAKDQFLSEGVSNIGQSLTAFGQQKNASTTNAIGLKILNEAFPNYYFDAGTINQMISGTKPSWMDEAEYQEAKILLYRSGLIKKPE